MGFGLFIFFALLVVILTNRSLERSRGINDQINNVYSPSVDALVRLRNLTVSAHMLIKHWALLESRADAPEKTNLVDLTGRQVRVVIDLHAGAATATITTTDLTTDYVHENSAYST